MKVAPMAHTPQPAEVIDGRYALSGQPAKERYGRAFRARDRKADREVHVYVLDAENGALTGSRLSAFQSSHPAFPRLHHVGGPFHGRPYLVFEPPAGAPPRSDLHRILAPEVIASVIDLLLGAVGFLHARDLAVGPLRTSRVFLSERGGRLAVQLPEVPFELLRPLPQRLLRDDEHPPYTAPEVLASESDLSVASDLFAVGAVAFELLSGATPFSENHADGARSRGREGSLPRLPEKVPRGLEELVRWLLSSDPDVRPLSAWDAREVLHDAVPSLPSVDPYEASDLVAPLVGRDEALDTVRTLAARLSRGSVRVRVEGPPGSGRGRFLAHATADLALAGVRTVSVRADTNAQDFARDLLTQASHAPGGDACAALVQGLTVASKVTPIKLHGGRGLLAQALTVSDAIRAVTRRTPLWITVHDAHRAPPDTLAFLRFVAQGDGAVAWMGAWDSSAGLADERPPVALRPLRRDEIARCLAATLPGIDTPSLEPLAALAERNAQGSVGRVLAGVTELLHAGALAMARGRWQLASKGAPAWAFDNCAQVRVVASLSAATRLILAGVAVAGAVRSPDVAANIAGVAPVMARTTLQKALGQGLVARATDGLTVAGPELTRALIATLDATNLEAFRRRALAALDGAETVAACQARSRLLEALGRTDAAAAEAWSAAVALEESGALHEAAAWIERARAFGMETPQAVLRHGDVLLAAGEVNHALAIYTAALAQGAPGEDCSIRKARALVEAGRYEHAEAALKTAGQGTEATVLRAWCAMMLGRVSEATFALEGVRESAGAVRDRARRQCLAAMSAWHHPEPGAVTRRVEAAFKVIAQAEDPAMGAEVAQALGDALAEFGDVPGAVACHRHALEAFRAQGCALRAARCERLLAHENERLGRWEVACAHWDAYLDLARRLDDPTDWLLSAASLASLWCERGDIPQAERVLERAFEVPRRKDAPRGEAAARGVLAEVRALRGELDEALAILGQAHELAQRVGAAEELVTLRRRRAAVLLARKEHREAAEAFKSVADELAAAGARREAARARVLLARALRCTGRWGEAASELENAALGFVDVAHRADEGLLALEQASLARARNEHPRARALAERAAGIFREVGAPRELAAAQEIIDADDTNDALARISAAVAGARSAEAMLGAALDVLLEMTGADRGAAALFGDGVARVAAWRASGAAGAQAPRVSRTIAERALASPRPVVITDMSVEPGVSSQESVVTQGLQAVLAAALRCEAEPLGMIYLDAVRGPADLVRWGVYPLEMAAAVLAPALRAAIERERERERANLLDGAARWLFESIAALDASLQVAAEEDDRSDRVLVTQGSRARAARWRTRADQMIAALREEDARFAAPAAVDLGAIARAVAAAWTDEPEVTVSAPDEPVTVSGDPETMAWLFAELVDLAAERAREGDESGKGARVTVRLARGDDEARRDAWAWRPARERANEREAWIRMEIEHTGRDLSDEDRTAWFDTSWGDPRRVRLAVARRILRRSGASLRVERRHGGGAVLVAEMPRVAASEREVRP